MRFDLEQLIYDRWRAGHGVLWLVSDEAYRIHSALQGAAERLQQEHDQDVQVLCHDKVAGFYGSTPPIDPPRDKTNDLLRALQVATASGEQLPQISADLRPPFNLEQDAMVLFKDVQDDLNARPPVVQLIRNLIQAQATSPGYTEDQGLGPRGKRLIVLLTPTTQLRAELPELKPLIVPLPDKTVLAEVIDRTFDGLAEAYREDPAKGAPPLEPHQREMLIDSLRGFTYLAAEDAVGLAVVTSKRPDEQGHAYLDFDQFLQTIEREKALMVERVQGLSYVAKDDLPAHVMPGYEPVAEFLRQRMQIPAELAERHRVKRVRGLAVFGAPGTGKSEFAKTVARQLDRILLLWSLGETQSGLVGQSEANARRAIQIAQALGATVLVDDVDKAGLNVARGGASGDSGTFGRIVQMLLTEMSDPDNQAVFVFTANRSAGVPGELLRPGRIDQRYFVQRPDGATRLLILKDHLVRHHAAADDETMLEHLAGDLTEEWTGAELAHLLVEEAVVQALGGGAPDPGQERPLVVSVEAMVRRAKLIDPMAKQPAYAEDIAQMEADCQQFERVGTATGATATPTRPARKGSGRSRRDLDA